MSTNFSTSLDAYTRPTGGNTLGAEQHSTLHDHAFDAIEAIEAYVGVTDSAVEGTLTKRIANLEAAGGESLPDVVVAQVSAFSPITVGVSGLTPFIMNEPYPADQTEVTVSAGVVTVPPGVWAIDALLLIGAGASTDVSATVQLVPGATNTYATSTYAASDAAPGGTIYISGTFYSIAESTLGVFYSGSAADVDSVSVTMTKIR